MLNQHGNYLKLIIGPMFSSKSSTLLSEINRYKYITDNMLVINHVFDKQRYPENNAVNFLTSHNGKTYPALMLHDLNELKTNDLYNSLYESAEIILIDEGQFFNDIYSFIKLELMNCNINKKFIIAGLSSDFNMNPIGEIINLIPIADDIIKLSALCIYCINGSLASFTKLHKYQSKQILIGASESYSPCCRTCFYKN